MNKVISQNDLVCWQVDKLYLWINWS